MLFSLFVFETLSFAVKEGLQKGTRIAYNQYEEREKNLAKVGVLQLIKSIEYGRTQTVLDEEFYKSEIIRMMKNGTLGKDSKRGFFVFDDSNVCLISYDFPEMEGYALDDLPVEISTGSHLSENFQTLRNGEITDGYFIHYYAGRSGTEKTSYIAYYPQWGWIVGAGYYGKDGEIFKKEQEALWGNFGKELNSRVMFRVLLFSLFIYSIILVITVLLKKSYATQMRLNNDYELFRDTLEENLCVMITDAEGRIQRVNHRYRELTDTEGLQISGRFFDTYIHPDTRRETAISMKNTLGEKELWTGTIKGLSQDGREFWIQSQIKPLYGINGSLNGYIAVGLDMTELQTIKENLKKSAFIDSLTGCGNWEKLLHDYEKTDSAYIAYYNIDAFSSIYQFYGLESSEQILIHITEKFIKMLDSDESLYRIDFDTFVIMHRGKEKQLFITRSRDRLKTVNEQILNLKDLRYHISMRAGIAMGAETENLVLADIALENAKNSTEGIAVLDDKSIPDSMEKKSEIQKLHLIKDAMVNEGLYLVYQPILNISGNYIEKYECLIRMKTENGEVCP
ncbi:MAG: PAS domain S-box protein, partial [Spirochaetales bacterium]|nr:PAS domain S-box protein [Spirochaetales bacterium]